MKKHLITLAIIIATVVTAIAQEHVGSQPLNFTAISDTLNESVWWEFQQMDGKWKSEPNKRSVGNFEWIVAKKLVHNGNTYYVLVFPTKTWGYKYPELRMDYYEYDIWKAILIEPKSYKKIMSPSTSVTVVPVKVVSTTGLNSSYNDLDWAITRSLNSSFVTFGDQLAIYLTNEGNVRFYFNVRVDESTLQKYKHYQCSQTQWQKLKIK